MLFGGTVVEEQSLLDRWLLEDFGSDSADLRALCCEAETGRPLYLSHVKLVLDCFPCFKPNHRQVDNLSRAYVYLIAVYYLVDAVADGHSCHGSSLQRNELVSSIPILQAAALGHFCALSSEYGSSVEVTCKKIIDHLSQNRGALQIEKDRQSRPFSGWADEFFHLWARSNCFIFLYYFVACLQRAPIASATLQGIQRLLAAIQRGDDSSDWREDFDRSCYTPFIRLCISRSHTNIDSSTLEELVYLQRVLEEELQALVREFEEINVVLRQFPESRPLAQLARQQYSLVCEKLTGLREAWDENVGNV